ncbi:MAG: 23S rRNA (pseudouridine(1915)-N(3))-methyltransferase RlmH [Clostridiales bacterium]|nr:23S rRNA (pseudouridine(1915)-N(3))-methyltransferase RlmH [Clostridiales bacterium]
MVKVNLVVVGKVKEKYFADGIAEYSKRLSRFCEFKIIEVSEENYAKVDFATENIIKEKEAERILPNLKGYVFSMAIEGKKTSSEGFANKLNRLISDGNGVITFVIGGSYGLSDKIKKVSNELFSFSEMTFPHTLFRLMLTEQIYRAFSINSGSAYHK